MIKQRTYIVAPSPARLFLRLLGIGLVLLSGCTTTQKATVTKEGLACSFLGGVCNKLTPGDKDQLALRYVNPTVRWTQYKKIMIDPVIFWGEDSTRIANSDQQLLVNYFHQQLTTELGKKFEITGKPGPGVLKLDLGILDAEAATPGLRSVSMVVPQAHMLSNLQYLATGSFPFVGGIQGAVKLTDSETGETLGAAVDRQIGGGSVAAGLQWEWGDAENAITEWSTRLAEKLSSWTTGTARP